MQTAPCTCDTTICPRCLSDWAEWEAVRNQEADDMLDLQWQSDTAPASYTAEELKDAERVAGMRRDGWGW